MDQMNFQRNHFHILLGLRSFFFVKNSLWFWIQQHFLFQLTDNRLPPHSPSSALHFHFAAHCCWFEFDFSSLFFLCVFWFPFQRRFSHNAMHLEHDDGCVWMWSVCGGPAAILHPTQSEKKLRYVQHNEILSDFRLKLRERLTQSRRTKLLVIFFLHKKVEKRATKYANLRPSIDKLLMKCQPKHRGEEVASNFEGKK